MKPRPPRIPRWLFDSTEAPYGSFSAVGEHASATGHWRWTLSHPALSVMRGECLACGVKFTWFVNEIPAGWRVLTNPEIVIDRFS